MALDKQLQAPEGRYKLVHFIAFMALTFPLASKGRFGLLPVINGVAVFRKAIELIQRVSNEAPT